MGALAAAMNHKQTEQGRVVVGMGQTGLSCARFLARQGLAFTVIDSRAEPPLAATFRAEFPSLPLLTGGFDPVALQQADEIILSPGVDPRLPVFRAAVAAGARLIGDIELLYRHARAPIVAITGTNAKSTVTTLVWMMAQQAGLRVACGGNLGTPALDLLASDVELYVLELSSFQLELVQDFHADVAAFLNLAPDHLDRYGDMQSYRLAKQRVYAGARCAVYNRDDSATVPPPDCAAVRVDFSLSAPAADGFGVLVRDRVEWLARGETALLASHELALKGRHNLANALAAMAIATAAGIAVDAQISVLRSYSGLPHRCQHVRSLDGVDYYDDSKGTNAAAAVAALRGLAGQCQGRIVLIAGGVAKERDFSALAQELCGSGRAAVLIGEAAPLLTEALQGALPLYHASTMNEAVRQSRALAQPGDIVLLSPACASFDMFRDYAQRGDVFAAAVNALDSMEGC